MSNENGQPDLQSYPRAEIEVMGQHFKVPMNACAFLSVLSLCLLIFGIFFLTSEVIKKTENPDKLLNSIIHHAAFFRSDGSQDKIKGRSYRFWTPAKETRTAVEGKISEEKLSWYTLDNGDKTLEDFGSALTERLHVQGYTRTFGWGQGTSPLKPGWSWVVTINDANNEFTLQKFLSLYKEYFHRNRDIYIEIVNYEYSK